MDLRRILISVLAVMMVFGLALSLSACETDGGDGDTDVTNGEDTEDGAEDGAEDGEATLQIDLVQEWSESGHAMAISFAAQREDCVRCHDGGAFAMGVEDPAELERDYPVAQDCRACHTGQGVELAQSGTISIPTAESVQAGMGALCMGCHNGRRQPDPAAERRSAPHHSVQADVLTGSGGMPLEGVDYLQTQSHTEAQDTCVFCHFPATEDGAPPAHTFQAQDFENSCQSDDCHSGSVDPEADAAADYDGDGSVEMFQEEVTGLLEMLNEAILEESGATEFVAESGELIFRSGEETVTPSNELYAAAYNYFVAEFDGSLGIHNPAFVVSMLRNTYESVTGEAPAGEMIEVEGDS